MALKFIKDIMTKDVITLSPEASLHDVVSLMSEKHISFIVIAKDRKALGFISERTLVNFLSTCQEPIAMTAMEIMEEPVVFLAGEDSDYLDAYQHLKEKGKRHLVVLDIADLIIGVVTLTDIINHIGIQMFAEEKSLRSFMTSKLKVMQPSSAMLDVIHTMTVNKISCMIIVEDERPVGIITERDISRCFEYGVVWKGKIAKDMMSCPLKTATPDMGATQAMLMMKEQNIRHLVLVRNDELAGVVTESDIASGIENAYVKNLIRFLDETVKEKTCKLSKELEEHKKSKEMLRKLSQAIEQSSESVMMTGLKGVIEYVNPAFESLTGYSAQEAVGQKSSILKSGNQNEDFYKKLWKTIIAGKRWQSKVIEKRKDGSFYPAVLTISPITNEQGEITNFVATHSDMSELEEMEQRFHQAQKMEALGTLVGGIAHDFNNMLAGITGNLYLMKKRVQEMPDMLRKLESVEQLSFRAADMIQQLLTFARKSIVSMKQIPLTAFIKETLKLLRTSVPENIKMNQNICADDLRIEGDATQLHQVLMNLLNNARDAVEGVDAPLLTVNLDVFQPDNAFLETHAYFNAGRYAHLSVKDNGCGIPEHQLKHLFEPFFTTKEEGKGTGLGLAMVFGAIKTHHGFFEVESVEGTGSTFHLYFPLLEVVQKASALQQGKGYAEGHGELILLADDEQHVLETGKDVLEEMGYRILTAVDGQQAVEIFEAHAEEIDLCIFDVVMPVLDGDKAAKCIRLLDHKVKIIFATGYDKNRLDNIAHETILSKPFAIEEMSRLVREVLDR